MGWDREEMRGIMKDKEREKEWQKKREIGEVDRRDERDLSI